MVDYAQTLACMQPCGEAGDLFRALTSILYSHIVCDSHVQEQQDPTDDISTSVSILHIAQLNHITFKFPLTIVLACSYDTAAI